MRIEAMQLKLEFQEKVADIKPSIATLATAMGEVLSCDMLTELFHIALIAGNIINGVSETHANQVSFTLPFCFINTMLQSNENTN